VDGLEIVPAVSDLESIGGVNVVGGLLAGTRLEGHGNVIVKDIFLLSSFV
jgi:hypothetical protein